jgi:type III secretion protein W
MTAGLSGPGRIESRTAGMMASVADRPAAGEWNGLAVRAADSPGSLLADAMEEMSFAASEKVEKDLSERKKTGKKDPLRQVIPPEAALRQMQERNHEKLKKFLAEIRAGEGNPAAFRHVLASFSDSTERHAALMWAEMQLIDAPSLAELAARERKRLETESSPEIQAGYNIDDVDASGVGGQQEGRDTYRRTILGQGGISAMLETIIESCSGNDFTTRVDYLRLAVGADISAALPSVDKRELESMNNDLFHLRALGNFTREFGFDLARIREKREKPPLPDAGLETLRLICRVKDERLVDLSGFKSCLALEKELDPSYDVQALTGAHNLIHRLPERLFADEDSRQRLLTASQKLLDSAVDLEETLSEDGA